MAAPNVGSAGVSAYVKILLDGQLSSGNNDFTVAANKAWALKSLTLCNTTSSAVTVGVQAKPSGGTFRSILSGYSLAGTAAGDGSNSFSLDLGGLLPAMLSDGSVVRITAGTGSAVDVLATGTELG